MCKYVYVYVCVYIYIYLYKYIYVYIHICICTCIYIYIYIYPVNPIAICIISNLYSAPQVLIDFLSIGCSVLLSDVDVIWLSDPFTKLYKDSDVEGMSDGWDEPTTYGENWPLQNILLLESFMHKTRINPNTIA